MTLSSYQFSSIIRYSNLRQIHTVTTMSSNIHHMIFVLLDFVFHVSWTRCSHLEIENKIKYKHTHNSFMNSHTNRSTRIMRRKKNNSNLPYRNVRLHLFYEKAYLLELTSRCTNYDDT